MSKALEKLFKELEQDIITDIILRMEKVPEIIPSSDYQIWRLNQIGAHKSYIKAIIQKELSLSKKEVNKIYKKVIDDSFARDKKLYEETGKDYIPYEENESLKQLVSAMEKQTNDECINITKTMGFVVNGQGVKEADYFRHLLDKTQAEIMTGSFDFNTSVKKAVNDMVNSGVRWIDYESGHHNRVDVAIRRACLTGVHQVTSKISEDNAKQLDTEYFEVSYHKTARPTHQVWQGRVYTKEQLVSICGLGTGEGLCGWNCYHHYDPFIKGVSVRKYTDEQLDKMNAEDNKRVSYGNKKYTKYQATQEQRRQETNLRALQEKIKISQKCLLPKDVINGYKIKYREKMDEYKKFSSAMGLPFQVERVMQANVKDVR